MQLRRQAIKDESKALPVYVINTACNYITVVTWIVFYQQALGKNKLKADRCRDHKYPGARHALAMDEHRVHEKLVKGAFDWLRLMEYRCVRNFSIELAKGPAYKKTSSTGVEERILLLARCNKLYVKEIPCNVVFKSLLTLTSA